MEESHEEVALMNFIMKKMLKITRKNQLKRISDTFGLIEQIRMKPHTKALPEVSKLLDNLYIDLKETISRFDADETYLMENHEFQDLACMRYDIKQMLKKINT